MDTTDFFLLEITYGASKIDPATTVHGLGLFLLESFVWVDDIKMRKRYRNKLFIYLLNKKYKCTIFVTNSNVEHRPTCVLLISPPPLINLPIFKTSGGNTGFAFYGTFYKIFYGFKAFLNPVFYRLSVLLKP